MIVATENDGKNAIGMMVGNLPPAVRRSCSRTSAPTGPGQHPQGQASTSASSARTASSTSATPARALDYALDIFKLVKGGSKMTVQAVVRAIQNDPALQKKLEELALKGTRFMSCNAEYFPGDGLSSHYRTPGGVPMTAYRHTPWATLSLLVIEGETVNLPKKVGTTSAA